MTNILITFMFVKDYETIRSHAFYEVKEFTRAVILQIVEGLKKSNKCSTIIITGLTKLDG